VPAASPAKKPDDQRPRFRRLSPHEIAEKRLSGQCYFCPEKFTKDHKCARKGVFLLELEDGEGSSEGDDTVSISLHALTGITAAHTMKLHVQVASVALVTLLDSGSTHNFINADIASKLGLHITPRPGLSINVANGERVASSGLCAATAMHVHGEQFSLDCYALPLDGFDVVLGVHWLRTLGPIIWNFDALTMLFWRDGRTVSSPWLPATTCSKRCWTPTATSSRSPWPAASTPVGPSYPLAADDRSGGCSAVLISPAIEG